MSQKNRHTRDPRHSPKPQHGRAGLPRRQHKQNSVQRIHIPEKAIQPLSDEVYYRMKMPRGDPESFGVFQLPPKMGINVVSSANRCSGISSIEAPRPRNCSGSSDGMRTGSSTSKYLKVGNSCQERLLEIHFPEKRIKARPFLLI